MSTHKYFDRICVVALVLSLLLTMVFVNGEALGIRAADTVMGYEDRLFDSSAVHTIDIVIDDWDGFLQTAQSEEYAACSVVIDGEAFKNVGIRGKGNTSLSTVSSMNSQRYSFKLEFDQYDTGKTYHGLDKLSLNNLIQDTTYLKDYLTYRMMAEFGAAAPLCSFVWITVNGEDWGLYLAVEAVEESFLQRNYGSDYGELYKPDSMNFGGGRGNGKDFNMEDFMASEDSARTERGSNDSRNSFPAEDFQMPDMGNFDPSSMGGFEMPDMGNFDPSSMEDFEMPDMGGFGMGSSDAKLQYVDDDPDSYSTIFGSAKTEISDADQARLIESLKQLSQGNTEDSLDIDAVLRYFVVHNYVVNGDSYTGSMIHNYYLYEENGKLSMIPWDYNLAFGTFQNISAEAAVNDDLDAPLSVTGTGDRPMLDWIFRNEAYTEQYHQYFSEFLNTVDPAAIIDEAAALIAPYVEKDPTAFYSYEEFRTGAETLREFCRLRTESVANQLSDGGTVDASHLNLSEMGTMHMGGSGFDRGEAPGPAPQMPGNAAMPERPGSIDVSQPNHGSFLPLASSVAVLLFGLLFAVLFRRRKS